MFAQNNGDSLKFEIIKASTNFLATDKATFPNSSGKGSTCQAMDYNCLLSFCRTNKLIGADKKVENWMKKSISSKDDLSKFKEAILTELTVGGEKAKRTKLDSYKKYNESLSKIASAFKETSATDIEDNTANNNNEASQPAKVETANEPIVPVVIKTTDPQEESSQGWLPLIAFLMSFLALGLGVYLFYKIKKRDEARKDFNSEYFKLKEDFKDLKDRFAQRPVIDIKTFEEKLRNIENVIQQNEQQSRKVELQIENRNYTDRQPPVNVRNIVQQYYAKLPDLGNGFSAGILAANQNGEQIFELEIRDDRATYVVSSDNSAQKYALSDFNYYLSNACDFLNQPVKNCRIHTQEKGTVVKSGNNWLIQNKAKIEFK